MSLNFFRQDCQFPPINDTIFGLCDDQNGLKAYPDKGNRENWIATVKNKGRLDITFTAIDKCVLQDWEHHGRGRCDGMLTTHRHLYLVELKDQEPPWRSDAIEQLRSTIAFLKTTHDISRFPLKKAFAANKKRPIFVAIDNEENTAFLRETDFRLDIQADILII